MLAAESRDCEGCALPQRDGSGGGGARDRQADLPSKRATTLGHSASPVLEESGAQPYSTEDRQLLPEIPGVRCCVCVPHPAPLSAAPCCAAHRPTSWPGESLPGRPHCGRTHWQPNSMVGSRHSPYTSPKHSGDYWMLHLCVSSVHTCPTSLS